MSKYTNDLGFTPSTVEENVDRLFNAFKKIMGLVASTKLEFMNTNSFLLFQGFSEEFLELQNQVIEIIDNFLTWINDTNSQITGTKVSTYQGVVNALAPLSTVDPVNGVALRYSDLNTIANDGFTLVPGELLIAIDTPVLDKSALRNAFSKLPGAVRTYTSKMEAGTTPYPDSYIDLELSNGQTVRQYYYTTKAGNTTENTYKELYINIKYRLLDSSVTSSNTTQTIKDAFLTQWNATMHIGVDFEPRAYLSTQNLDFIATAEVGYSEVALNDPNFIQWNYVKKDCDFWQKYVIHVTNGVQDITVQEDPSLDTDPTL